MENHLVREGFPLSYINKFREYGIDYPHTDSFQIISFCPWCGEKLPDPLRDKWFDELDKLGLEPGDNLPDDLLSDEWWKKG